MKSIGDVSDNVDQQDTHENAMRVFQFDPFAPGPRRVHRGRAAGRVPRRRPR